MEDQRNKDLTHDWFMNFQLKGGKTDSFQPKKHFFLYLVKKKIMKESNS